MEFQKHYVGSDTYRTRNLYPVVKGRTCIERGCTPNGSLGKVATSFSRSFVQSYRESYASTKNNVFSILFLELQWYPACIAYVPSIHAGRVSFT